MRLNDSDVKHLVDTCYEMNDRLIRIEERVNAIHACNGNQDVKIKENSEKIGFLETAVAQINVKLVVLFSIDGIFGGLISSVVIKFFGL